MPDDESRIRSHLVFVVKRAHKSNRIPVVIVHDDVFAFGQSRGNGFVPVTGVNQIAFCIAFGHEKFDRGIHLARLVQLETDASVRAGLLFD
jgi:hypothetical protein